MKKTQQYLPWTIRILISLLFLISAVAKLYPSPYFAISTFEVKQLYTLGFTENIAPFFSRILIGIEFALGFLLLSKHFLKRLTIPATLLMLVVFTTHLTIISFFNGGNQGNCGCFGELIPMTPIEAIIKNVIAIALLVWLLFLLKNKPDAKFNFWVLTTVTLASILGLFMLTFSQPVTNQTELVMDVPTTQNPQIAPIIDNSTTIPAEINPVSATTISQNKIVETVMPTIKSGYAKYFSNIDKGNKILCFFVPGCEHCQATAKELTELKAKNPNFPEVQILFMDEEAEKIPEFFTFAGAKYNYKIIDIIGFWKILGTNKDVPGVKLLKDGKEIKYYFGTADNKFDSVDLLKLL